MQLLINCVIQIVSFNTIAYVLKYYDGKIKKIKNKNRNIIFKLKVVVRASNLISGSFIIAQHPWQTLATMLLVFMLTGRKLLQMNYSFLVD